MESDLLPVRVVSNVIEMAGGGDAPVGILLATWLLQSS